MADPGYNNNSVFHAHAGSKEYASILIITASHPDFISTEGLKPQKFTAIGAVRVGEHQHGKELIHGATVYVRPA